jgi:WD40 repeat protein
VESGKELRRVEAHRGGIFRAEISPDGRWIITGGQDGEVKLWDATTGREVQRLPGHGNWVLSVAFAPDGRHALSAGGGAGYDGGYTAGSDFSIRLLSLPMARLTQTKPNAPSQKR